MNFVGFGPRKVKEELPRPGVFQSGELGH
jgi:hypothetical protein